jgi:hypothetical protein
MKKLKSMVPSIRNYCKNEIGKFSWFYKK